MESASRLSALAQPFGVGDALKSWFGLFNLFLEANQIIVEENLHALTFSDIATSRELLRRQLQLITSSRSATLASDREVNNLPLAAGLAGARRVDPLKVVHSPVSITRQERRRAYRRKRNARLNSSPLKCGPPAVEPQYIISHSSSFTDCDSDFTDNSFLTSSKERGVTNYVATDSDIDSVSNPEKIGVMALVLSASTSLSTLRKFPPRQPFTCSLQNSRRLVCQEIHIPAWPTHYSNAYNLFQSSSFTNKKFQVEPCFFGFGDKIRSQDSSVTLPDYFRYSLYRCVKNLSNNYLKCCSSCGNKCPTRNCLNNCSDCTNSNHCFYFCPKLLRWLHDPDTSHHLLWKNVVKNWIISYPPPPFKANN
jgi:hypothetical protein